MLRILAGFQPISADSSRLESVLRNPAGWNAEESAGEPADSDFDTPNSERPITIPVTVGDKGWDKRADHNLDGGLRTAVPPRDNDPKITPFMCESDWIICRAVLHRVWTHV